MHSGSTTQHGPWVSANRIETCMAEQLANISSSRRCHLCCVDFFHLLHPQVSGACSGAGRKYMIGNESASITTYKSRKASSIEQREAIEALSVRHVSPAPCFRRVISQELFLELRPFSPVHSIHGADGVAISSGQSSVVRSGTLGRLQYLVEHASHPDPLKKPALTPAVCRILPASGEHCGYVPAAL